MMWAHFPRLVVAVLFVGLFSQIPEFFRQYTPNVDSEIRNMYASMYSLRGVREREDMLMRREQATRHLREMRTSSAATRPLTFLTGANANAVWVTIRTYKPTTPRTREHMAYGAIGFMLGNILFGMILRLARRTPTLTVDRGASAWCPPWLWQGLILLAIGFVVQFAITGSL